MTEAKFNTGEVTLNYAEGPDAGPALVLLHGGSARWQYFEGIIPELAAHWHLFAPDLRGHGQSGRVAGRYALRDYAEDICAFLLKVSGPASLFGHSLGGMAALMTADHCPDFVNAVVVGDSPLDARSWKAHLDDRQREQIRGWQALAGGSHSILDDFDNVMAGYDLEAFGPAIECPVLLLQADAQMGSATTDAEVARALACLPRGRHKRFPGLSHLLFIEDKAVVLQAVEEFLMQVEEEVV